MSEQTTTVFFFAIRPKIDFSVHSVLVFFFFNSNFAAIFFLAGRDCERFQSGRKIFTGPAVFLESGVRKKPEFFWHNSTKLLGCGCSAAVEHSSPDGEVEGSNPAGCQAFFSPTYSLQPSNIAECPWNQVPQRGGLMMKVKKPLLGCLEFLEQSQYAQIGFNKKTNLCFLFVAVVVAQVLEGLYSVTASRV